jgi:hypothetical protein
MIAEIRDHSPRCEGIPVKHIIQYYYTSLSFFLFKNMTVVLLLHPKINCLTSPGGPGQKLQDYSPLW